MTAAVASVLTIFAAALSFQCNALKRDAGPVDAEFIAYLQKEYNGSPTTADASPVEEVDMQGFDQLISLDHTSRSYSLQHDSTSELVNPSSPAVAEYTSRLSSLEHPLVRKKTLSVAAVAAGMKGRDRKLALAEKASIGIAALPKKEEEEKSFVAAVAAKMKREERKLTASSSLQQPAAKKAILSATAIAATMTGREKTLLRTPVRMPGNGWCQDAEGQESTARRVVSVKCMDAQNLCSADASCVAWACNDDLERSILYTSMGCEIGCEETRWLRNPNLIEKAGYDENGDHPKWQSASCFRWTQGETHPVVPAAARESNPIVPADVIESLPADVVPEAEDLSLARKVRTAAFVRVPGNGLCMDASNTDTAARRFIQGDCDRAAQLCDLDVNCVAWNCHDDASPHGVAILYTDNECVEGCDNKKWVDNGPGAIDHAAPVQGKPEFALHSCYRWRT